MFEPWMLAAMEEGHSLSQQMMEEIEAAQAEIDAIAEAVAEIAERRHYSK